MKCTYWYISSKIIRCLIQHRNNRICSAVRGTGQGVIVKPIKKHNPRMTKIRNICLKDNMIFFKIARAKHRRLLITFTMCSEFMRFLISSHCKDGIFILLVNIGSKWTKIARNWNEVQRDRSYILACVSLSYLPPVCGT